MFCRLLSWDVRMKCLKKSKNWNRRWQESQLVTNELWTLQTFSCFIWIIGYTLAMNVRAAIYRVQMCYFLSAFIYLANVFTAEIFFIAVCNNILLACKSCTMHTGLEKPGFFWKKFLRFFLGYSVHREDQTQNYVPWKISYTRLSLLRHFL